MNMSSITLRNMKTDRLKNLPFKLLLQKEKPASKYSHQAANLSTDEKVRRKMSFCKLNLLKLSFRIRSDKPWAHSLWIDDRLFLKNQSSGTFIFEVVFLSFIIICSLSWFIQWSFGWNPCIIPVTTVCRFYKRVWSRYFKFIRSKLIKNSQNSW